jgi:phage tail sheath gpL-like
VDPSKAGLPTVRLPALLVGTMLTSGDATPDKAIAVGSQAQADAHFGEGSELARMFKAYFANNFANEVWGLGVSEPVGGTAATGTITVVAPPTSPGALNLYIGGQHVQVVVMTTDTIAAIATNITDAINNAFDLPVTAVAAAAVVTLTANWKGINGNDIRVDLNYFGSVGGEITPIGLDITLPATGFLTGGAGDPDFDNAIAGLGEQQFEYVAMPYTDGNSIFSWDQEYGFTDTGRWGWRRQLYGHVFSAKRGTYPNLITFGATNNSGVISIMAFESTVPSPMYEAAAAYVGKAQRALIDDPARPLQTLVLNQIKLAPINDRFNTLELNALATSGLATQKPSSDGVQPMVSRESTTYQLNPYGHPDDAYELVTTLATLAKLIRNQRQMITSKYPRHKLANDGTRFGPGQAIVTPGIIKGELIAQYRQDEFNGLVEDTRNFKNFLLVERNPNDPNRLDILYPPDLINQLRIFAVLAQFRLQYDRGPDSRGGGGGGGVQLGFTGQLPS